MNITFDTLKAALERLGYAFFATGTYNLNIIGVRSLDTTTDQFNDYLTECYLDEAGQKVCKVYAATTDPGLYYLQQPMNVSGTAILIAPQQVRSAYQIGKHNGKYRALRQIKPLKFVRDTNLDNRLDYYDPAKDGQTGHTILEDVIGANIHRAHETLKVARVGKFSAACQVIHLPENFKEFMGLVDKAAARYGDKFTYTLIREDHL